MSVPRCKFYLQGYCQYGTSCRFLHSNDRGGHRSNGQHYDEYRPNNNRYGNQSNYDDEHYERNNYHSGGRGDNYHSSGRGDNYHSNGRGDNYHSNGRGDYYHSGGRGDNYQSGVRSGKYQSDDRDGNYQSGGRSGKYQYGDRDDNYHSGGRGNNYSKKDFNGRNNYDQRKNYYEDGYNSSNKYDDNYGIVNKYQSKNNYGTNNHKDNDFDESRNNNYDHKHNNGNNHFNNKNQEKFTNNVYKNHHPSNRYNESNNQFTTNYNQTNFDNRNRKQKIYENEIKTYQTHTHQLIDSRVWPLTCFHPIGSVFPIQPVGCLNFIDVSFEEIRCDYYTAKSVCANPESVHKQTVEDLMAKARKLKTDVISLKGSALDDLIATFEKCEESKTNNAFVNSIQADQNSYWDMSIRELKKPKNTKSEIDSFSFVSKNDNSKNDNSKNAPTLKILMQNEVYGSMDCEAFAQDKFTDYIPIMPPPRKYCL